MFLSKIIPDRRRWDVARDLENRDYLHKMTMSWFPDFKETGDHVRQKLGVLYRIDRDVLLLQSRMAPDSRLKAGYMLVGTKDVAKNYEAVRKGGIYEFRLEANTSVQVSDEPIDWIPEEGGVQTKTRVKRVGCGNYPARGQWLERMAERWGFGLETYSMNALPILRVKGGGVLEVCLFTGRLRVADQELFLRALCEGIGQGKPYGLGLLSIRNA